MVLLYLFYYRKQIPLDKNEGIYIQNVQNGQVCLVISTLRISFKDFFVSKTCKQMLNYLVLVLFVIWEHLILVESVLLLFINNNSVFPFVKQCKGGMCQLNHLCCKSSLKLPILNNGLGFTLETLTCPSLVKGSKLPLRE